MNNKIFLIIKLSFLVILAASHSVVFAWEQVGNRVYHTASAGKSVTMTFNPKTYGLYLLYSAISNNNIPILEKFIESTNTWQIVSKDFTSPTSFNRISFDLDGNLYFAYQDKMYQSGKASVLKFDGKNWVYVGKQGFSDGPIGYMWFNMQNGKIPYVLFPDTYVQSRLSMMKYTESTQTWEYVGNRGFSTMTSNGAAFNFDASTSQPYVVYSDQEHSGASRVMTFVNESWINVGNQPCTGWGSSNNRIAINPNNHYVYIAYDNSTNLEVRVYDGQTWSIIGSNLSKGIVADISFFLDPVTYSPHIAYVDTSENNKITAKVYNGESWEVLENPDFSASANEVTGAWNALTNKTYYAYPEYSGLVQVKKEW